MRFFSFLAVVFLARPLCAEVGVKTDLLGNMPDPAKIVITDITPSGHDIIMAALKPDGIQDVLVNGKVVATEPDIRGVAVNPGGEKYAYVSYEAPPQGAGFRLATNWAFGVKGLGYENITGLEHAKKHFAQLNFSPDGQHLAYVAKNKGEGFAVVDGQEQKHFGGVYEFVFSSDSRHWAILARQIDDVQSPSFCVIDGAAGDTYIHMHFLAFIPQTTSTVFVALFAGHLAGIVMDGKDIDPATDVVYNIVFSADGKHYAYKGNRKIAGMWPTQHIVVVDGQVLAPQVDPSVVNKIPPTIGDVTMSSDGAHVAYVREDATGDRVVHPGGINGSLPRGSGIEILSQSRVVLDGAMGPVVDEVTGLAFSPHGTHFGYAARVKKQWQAVIDNNPGPLFDMVSSQVSFSPDGKHFAYAARKDGQWRMVLDGTEIPDFIPLHERFQEDNDPDPPTPGFRFSFDSDGTLIFIASKAGSLYRVYATPAGGG